MLIGSNGTNNDIAVTVTNGLLASTNSRLVTLGANLAAYDTSIVLRTNAGQITVQSTASGGSATNAIGNLGGYGTNTFLFGSISVTNPYNGTYFFVDTTNSAWGTVQTNGYKFVWTNGLLTVAGATNTSWFSNIVATGWGVFSNALQTANWQNPTNAPTAGQIQYASSTLGSSYWSNAPSGGGTVTIPPLMIMTYTNFPMATVTNQVIEVAGTNLTITLKTLTASATNTFVTVFLTNNVNCAGATVTNDNGTTLIGGSLAQTLGPNGQGTWFWDGANWQGAISITGTTNTWSATQNFATNVRLVDTSTGAVYLALAPLSGFTYVKTNSAYSLFLSGNGVTNQIDGSIVWVRTQYIGTNWFLQW